MTSTVVASGRLRNVDPVLISDAGDPRLDDFRALTDADVRPDRRGLVIGEGQSVVERLVGARCRVRAVVGVESKLSALRPALDALGCHVYQLDKWTLSDVVGFRVTRGVLASADRPAAPTPADLVARARRVVVCEGLNDFENLGALFRAAAGFGVDAMLLDRRCADPLYRRSVRVSMGHALRVPFAVLDDPWPAALGLLREHGVGLLAMTPAGDTDLRDVETDRRWAVLVGAEGPGLAPATLAAADQRVSIGMSGGVDSLNVATATAIALWHLGGARS